jgi:agmatinase
MAQQRAFEYIQSGLTHFFRVPQSSPRPTSADAAVIGVPFDAGTTYAPGARFAPWEVRRASALIQPYHPVHSVDVFADLRVVDGGNAVFPPFDADAMRESVRACVSGWLDAGARPFVVGGDHSVALPVLRALARRHGPVAVLHVDAHFDTSGPETWGTEHHHGTPFRHALQEGLIAEGQLVQVGLRGAWAGPGERDLLAQHRARSIAMSEIDERGLPHVLAEVRERLQGKPVYISFDVDAIDPAFAPGTGTPVPGGLTTREALALLRSLAGHRIAGMDVVEVCPAADHAGVTSLLAASLLFEGLALAALQKHAG